MSSKIPFPTIQDRSQTCRPWYGIVCNDYTVLICRSLIRIWIIHDVMAAGLECVVVKSKFPWVISWCLMGHLSRNVISWLKRSLLNWGTPEPNLPWESGLLRVCSDSGAFSCRPVHLVSEWGFLHPIASLHVGTSKFHSTLQIVERLSIFVVDMFLVYFWCLELKESIYSSQVYLSQETFTELSYIKNPNRP